MDACGMFGLYSKAYRLIRGKPAPFEYACVEHDADYAEVVTSADRLAADKQLYFKVSNAGYSKTAKCFYVLVRQFGYLAIIKRNIQHYFSVE